MVGYTTREQFVRYLGSASEVGETFSLASGDVEKIAGDHKPVHRKSELVEDSSSVGNT